MKNDESGQSEAFEYDTPISRERNVYKETLLSPETQLQETVTHELSVVAAQLADAACKARDGDREATTAHIAHAIALLTKNAGGGLCGIDMPSKETRIARGGIPAWQMRRVFAHVEANLCRKIPVLELAQLLHFSASHFCRAFKCTFGIPPREYVLRRRIEVAQGLMLTTSEPLSSIAFMCGMYDQAHFTRAFHRVVGETPYAWRRTRRGALENRLTLARRTVSGQPNPGRRSPRRARSRA